MGSNSLVGRFAAEMLAWLLDNFSWFFDGLSSIIESVLLWMTDGLLAVPAFVMIAIFTIAALLVQGWRLALFSLLSFALINYMGMWEPSMVSLAIVAIAAIAASTIGIPLGILTARNSAAREIIRPILDFLQTMPTFVYLIPVVFFFGIGAVPGMVATVVFAIAPVIRLTELGIRQVDPEIVEALNAFGATQRKMLFEVQLPLAKKSIFAGVNQMIMLALSMVVIMGMVGGGGLGSIVVRAVARLDIATGTEAGLAVVLMAVYLDRLTGALANPSQISLWFQRRQKSSATSRSSRDEPVQVS